MSRKNYLPFHTLIKELDLNILTNKIYATLTVFVLI